MRSAEEWVPVTPKVFNQIAKEGGFLGPGDEFTYILQDDVCWK